METLITILSIVKLKLKQRWLRVFVFICSITLIVFISVLIVGWIVYWRAEVKLQEERMTFGKLMESMSDRYGKEIARQKGEIEGYRNIIKTLSTNAKRMMFETLFEVTAYGPDESCYPFNDNMTSTGLEVGLGIAATDPAVIPHGMVLYFPALRLYCYAGDVGGKIKGFKIDLFCLSEQEAKKFGRRRLKVERIELRL